MWPISPANPLAPRTTSPLTTRPPPRAADSPARTSRLRTPGRLGAKRIRPSRSMRPGAPTPTGRASPTSAWRKRATPARASRIAGPPRGVGTRCSATTFPSPSRTTPRSLVPPRSIPMAADKASSGEPDALDARAVRGRLGLLGSGRPTGPGSGGEEAAQFGQAGDQVGQVLGLRNHLFDHVESGAGRADELEHGRAQVGQGVARSFVRLAHSVPL